MTGDTSGFLETERKYDVAPGFVLPDLSALPAVAALGPARIYHLHATYYDTPDRRLAGARITLRWRRGGADDGWHLKLPAGPDSRREIHAPPGAGDVRTVPPHLADLVAGHTGRQPLRPIARLDTVRTERSLIGPGGQSLAEIADDTVTGFLPGPGGPGTWREAARWREVEIELASGGPGLLDQAGRAVLAAGAKPAALGSKLARLLAS